MKRSRIVLCLLAICAIIGLDLMAQSDSVVPKFKVAPTGRVLFDGAVFAPTEDTFTDGVAFSDVRLGVKASYGDFSARIDLAYGSRKLGLSDIYIQWAPNCNHLLKLGYFVHHFGLTSATSSSMKPQMISATSEDFIYGPARNLGLMYLFDKGQWFAGVSAFAAGTNIDNFANTQGKVSFGGLGRFVWRPFHADGRVLQIGVSPWYQGASHERLEDGKTGPGFFNFKASYPTKVDNVTLLSAKVDNARGVFKLSPELLLSAGPFALESQYYYMNVNRRHCYGSYSAQGVYGIFRALIFGDKEYGYSHGDASLARPKGKTLECVVGYNYTNANSSHAKICGGITNDASVTFNYYINKYMLARLRYSYTNCFGLPDEIGENGVRIPNPGNRHVNIIQARVMFLF